MRIDGVTCCVGDLYASYLRRSLPVWLETLDSLTVVTGWRDPLAWLWSPYDSIDVSKLTVKPSQAFTRNGAHFNKGAALNEGIAAAKPTDWVLSFDCDIIPPKDWRTIAEQQIEPGNLCSARRYQDGKQLDKRFYPRGYFQLWHVSDPHLSTPIHTNPHSGPFAEHYIDAAGYDTDFANQWPKEQQIDLGFKLTHQGEKSRYWCGPGTTSEQQGEAMERWRERQRHPTKIVGSFHSDPSA